MMHAGVESGAQTAWDRVFDILADKPAWLTRQLDFFAAGTTFEVRRTQLRKDGRQLTFGLECEEEEAPLSERIKDGKMIQAQVRMNLATIAANVTIEAGLPIEDWEHVLPLVEELAAKRKPKKPKMLKVKKG
jgi:hypothetical protein